MIPWILPTIVNVKHLSKPILATIIELLVINRSLKWGLLSIFYKFLKVLSALLIVWLNFFILIINL